MPFTIPDIFFIQTLPEEYLERCIRSFNETVDSTWSASQLHVIQELATRETTLNEIISKRDGNRDLFIVADDIVFLKGWHESLIENYNNGDIIGFSMIDAMNGLLQDYGYDFITIDGDISYRGLYKYLDVTKVNLPSYRQCDAITGCAMLIKNKVFDDVLSFPSEGANRWGELLFSFLAGKAGYKTIVLSAHLNHFAISTKQKNSNVSSISWLIEKELWKEVQKKYLSDLTPLIEVKTEASEELNQIINDSKKCLVYGAGTIANSILHHCISIEQIDICSGMSEEIGLALRDKTILDIGRTDINGYDTIIVSPIGYEEIIYDKYFVHTLDLQSIKYVTLSKRQDGNSMIIEVNQIMGGNE
jgi:hypothetical protein